MTKRAGSSIRKTIIADNLKKIRTDKHLSKAAVARMSHIPYTTYDSYERGDREPSNDRLRIIARDLGTEWWRLLGFESFQEWALDQSERSEIFYPHVKSAEEELESEMAWRQWDDLLDAYSRLNDDGKAEAVKRVQELCEISRYRFE